MAENLKENAPDLEAINSDDDGSTGGANNDSSTGGANNDSSSSQWHRGYIQGNTFENKEVKYMIINGKAVFEGDIILASTPKQIERLSQRLVRCCYFFPILSPKIHPVFKRIICFWSYECIIFLQISRIY
jgi:hypothetical protein